MSAILAKGYAYHSKCSTYTDSIHDQQRLLLFHLVHCINREQELAAPMVMSYLMGWGDTYCSHHYTPIYWSSFVSSLLEAFPELTKSHPVQSGSDNEMKGCAASKERFVIPSLDVSSVLMADLARISDQLALNLVVLKRKASEPMVCRRRRVKVKVNPLAIV
jgi:hypothetical protein